MANFVGMTSHIHAFQHFYSIHFMMTVFKWQNLLLLMFIQERFSSFLLAGYSFIFTPFTVLCFALPFSLFYLFLGRFCQNFCGMLLCWQLVDVLKAIFIIMLGILMFFRWHMQGAILSEFYCPAKLFGTELARRLMFKILVWTLRGCFQWKLNIYGKEMISVIAHFSSNSNFSSFKLNDLTQALEIRIISSGWSNYYISAFIL